MKALTVKQPWAELIALGVKKIENRTWPTTHRGPLAIHAGRTTLDVDTIAELQNAGITIPADLAYGAVVAVVTVTDCIRLADLPPDLAGDPFAFGSWCWLLADARAVNPVQWRGALGLWEFPKELA